MNHGLQINANVVLHLLDVLKNDFLTTKAESNHYG